ncbi:MAG: hypothetical protein WBB65_13225 [Anaerolineales bacterium]
MLTPTALVIPSAMEAIATARLLSMPERTWPPVTTGPYPPPLIP